MQSQSHAPFTPPAAILLCLLLSGCPGGGDSDGDGDGGGITTPRTPTELRISQNAVTVDEGATAQLTATVYDQNGGAYSSPPAGYEVLWSSNSANIASVNGTGLVTGNASGQTQVRANAGSLSAAASVTVNAVGGTITGAVTLSAAFQPVYALGAASAAFSGPKPRDRSPKRWPSWLGSPEAPPASMAAQGQEFTSNTLLVTYRPAAVAAPAHTSADWRRRDVAEGVSGRIRRLAEARLASLPARVEAVLPIVRTARVMVESGASLDQVRERLAQDPAVLRVAREPLVRLQQVPGGRFPNDPGYSAQAWHYVAMDLPAAWRITTGSSAVVVAVVDDGIRFDHPDLAPRLTSDGFDFVSFGQTVPVCGGGAVDNSIDGNGWDPDPR